LVPLATTYDMFLFRKIKKHIYPIVKERLRQFEQAFDGKSADTEKLAGSQPNDYVQWALKYAFTQNKAEPLERTPDVITRRLIVLNFASMHATIVTITNLLFDIACHPESLTIQRVLREEITEARANNVGKEWSRASLAQMVKVDSAIRESMRLWGFSTRGVSKEVMPREGVVLPSGEHLPCGVKVGITNWGAHHDESNYSNPYKYEPWRFYEMSHTAGSKEPDGKESRAPKRGPSMTVTEDHFLGFSHGRHAW
jgi:cytochrome P450